MTTWVDSEYSLSLCLKNTVVKQKQKHCCNVDNEFTQTGVECTCPILSYVTGLVMENFNLVDA